MATTVQTLLREFEDDIKKAEMYYSILSTLNNLDLRKKEIELISFVAVRGGVTSPAAREKFIEMFDSSNSSISNMISRLKKKNIFLNQHGKVKLNPVIALDFTKPLLLKISLNGETKATQS